MLEPAHKKLTVLVCCIVIETFQMPEFSLFCYWTQVHLLTTQKLIIWEASVSRKERCFNQKSWQSGEKVDSCPKTSFENSAQLWQLLKGRMRGKYLSESLSQEVGFWILSIKWRLADSSDVILPEWSACRISRSANECRVLASL